VWLSSHAIPHPSTVETPRSPDENIGLAAAALNERCRRRAAFGMATTSTLRLRRSAAQLHALVQVEREIRATDRNGRLKYLRDFRSAFSAYESVLTRGQLDSILLTADVLLVGDYHALPASQRFATQLVTGLARSAGRPVVLGLETVFARDQHILDLWMREQLSHQELRERIRFDFDWGYEWHPFFELLQAGRSHAQAIYGLDCMPRSDMRRIAARDRHAAIKIAEIRKRHPDAIVVVLFGESHLAPNHLPEFLRARLPRDRIVTVLQNVDALYWQAAGERDDNVEAVRVAPDVVCAFNSTPLEKYESYRLCIERWRQERACAPDLAPSIYNLVDALLRFLNVNKYSATNHTQPRFLVDLLPEVYRCTSEEQWRKLLSREGLTEVELKSVLACLAERGCCYVPRLNAICAADFRIVQGAEEIARFVHHACRGALRRGDAGASIEPEDLFYARVLEHALAYLGSQVLFRARPVVREIDLYALYSLSGEAVEEQTGFGYHEFMQMVDFLVMHKDYEANHRHYLQPPVLIHEGLRYRNEKREYATRQLGYILGSDLYKAYLTGRIAKRFLRALFLKPLDKPEAARAAYFAAAAKVRLPRRRRLP
jgi:Haem-binding uptake, Tiki superfamily, ChaN